MADHDPDRGEVAGTGEDGVTQHTKPQPSEPEPSEPEHTGSQHHRLEFYEPGHEQPGHDQPGPPRLFGQQPPPGTWTGLSPPAVPPSPHLGLPDAFAPGVPLEHGSGAPGLDDAGAEPDDAGDPYGTPDDYDTADPYGSRGGLAAIGLAPDDYDSGDYDAGDYDAGDEYRPPDDYGEPGPDSPLSLILNSGAPPGQFGSRPPPAAESRSAAQEGSDAGPAELGTAAAGSAAWAGSAAQPPLPPQSQELPAPPQPPPRPQPGPQPPPGTPRTVTADSLTTDLLLPGRHKAPSGGWRRAIFEVTGGLVRAPESAAERRRRELIARARTPVRGGHHRVAVLSLKGGVGKTTTTVGLGATLASLRGDRVIAVDANPDRGTLSDKLRMETSATVRDLVSERDQIQRYADVRAYTTQAASRLEVLASDRDPTVTVAFSGEDYCHVCQVLEQYYSICITDCGTGLLHSAMAGVLRLADQVVLVSSPSVDGARSASATLDWLQAHGYDDLVRNAVVVLSVIRPRGKSAVDTERLEQHFAARCRAVVRVPYDTHLDEGAEVELGRLHRATADAYLMLAAEIGDGFARPPQAPR